MNLAIWADLTLDDATAIQNILIKRGFTGVETKFSESGSLNMTVEDRIKTTPHIRNQKKQLNTNE